MSGKKQKSLIYIMILPRYTLNTFEVTKMCNKKARRRITGRAFFDLEENAGIDTTELIRQFQSFIQNRLFDQHHFTGNGI